MIYGDWWEDANFTKGYEEWLDSMDPGLIEVKKCDFEQCDNFADVQVGYFYLCYQHDHLFIGDIYNSF